MLLGVVSADALIVVLALMLMLSAYKIFKHTKGGA
jgi:hypothetical protein